MTEVIKVPLSKPVTHNEASYSELTFREATVGDYMASDQFKGEVSQNVAVLSAISDVPIPAFKKICAADYRRILDATKDLLGNA